MLTVVPNDDSYGQALSASTGRGGLVSPSPLRTAIHVVAVEDRHLRCPAMVRPLLICTLACALSAAQAPTVVLDASQRIIRVTVESGDSWSYERDATGRICVVSMTDQHKAPLQWFCVTAEDGTASHVVGPEGTIDPHGGTIRWDGLALVLTVPGKPATVLVEDPRSL
ncbi:MAG: RHS repeat protein [Planctomycetes bacterium]|nr:RHS repeat protein [Planctomycetota bacterium]